MCGRARKPIISPLSSMSVGSTRKASRVPRPPNDPGRERQFAADRYAASANSSPITRRCVVTFASAAMRLAMLSRTSESSSLRDGGLARPQAPRLDMSHLPVFIVSQLTCPARALLHSQFEALEEPGLDEKPITISIEPKPREIVAQILSAMNMAKDALPDRLHLQPSGTHA
jgi:hypothetical protein